MKEAYTIEFFEDSCQPSGLFEVADMYEAFTLIKSYKPQYKTKVIIRKHQIKNDCEICSACSIVDEITLMLIPNKNNEIKITV